MKLKPIEDRVILRAIDAADMTTGGVILPDVEQEGTITAEVIAVGPGKPTLNGDIIQMITKIGDTVILPKYGSTRIEVDSEDFMVCRESELLTILEKKNAK